MLTLNNLQSPKGANRATKRLGRGQASGQGTQAGKGHKGQKARKSGHVRTGFEGNNLPLYMRLPKRGFCNVRFAESFAVVTLENIEVKFEKTEKVNSSSKVSSAKEVASSKSMNSTKIVKKALKNDMPKGLLYLLCFLMPWLAVGFATDWDIKTVIINILWTFLCGIPGIIHAIIIVGRNS